VLSGCGTGIIARPLSAGKAPAAPRPFPTARNCNGLTKAGGDLVEGPLGHAIAFRSLTPGPPFSAMNSTPAAVVAAGVGGPARAGKRA